MAEPTTKRRAKVQPGKIGLGTNFPLMILACGGFDPMCNGIDVLVSFVRDPVVFMFARVSAGCFRVPCLLTILWLDRNEKAFWYLVLSALFWQGMVATGLSGIANTIVDLSAASVVANEALASQLTASTSASIVEGTTEGAARLMPYFCFRNEFDNVLDGVIYGALVGLGFAVYENWSYHVHQPGGVAGVLLYTWKRGVVSAAGGSHATFAALTGLGIGLFRVSRYDILRWLFPPLGLAAAMFLTSPGTRSLV